MAEPSLNQSRVIVSITLISIIYNLIFFSLFILLYIKYPFNIVFYTMAFLLFYIIMAQPLKDYITSYFLFRITYPQVSTKPYGKSKVYNMASRRDIQTFLGDFIKSNNLKHAYLVFEDKDQHCYFLTRDREFQKLNPERYRNSKLLQYIKIRPEPRNKDTFPVPLQKFLDEQGWQTIIPVLFRSSVTGFLAFPVKLDKKMTQFLEKYVQRIGLLFANEAMAEKALSTKLFQKEYTLAKRLEKILLNISNESYGNYMAYSPFADQEKKPFSILVDKTLSGPKGEKHYYLICRISEKSHRSAIMLLFAVQGYFFIASRKVTSLSGLVKNLNSLLVRSETGSILDGVLVEHQSKTGWKFVPFGKQVSLEFDKSLKNFNLPPLGKSEKNKYTALKLKRLESVYIKIKGQDVFHIERH